MKFTKSKEEEPTAPGQGIFLYFQFKRIHWELLQNPLI